MGVKLDWQIEAERIFQRTGEDPTERRRRWRMRLRVALLTLFVMATVAALFGIVAFRLATVDSQLRQDLIDTVQAEVAALRIGDYAGFANIQRSASPNWIIAQNERFQRYQEMKATEGVNLTGRVVDVALDGPRGRVVLEEIINGIPYHTVWFYWRYTDGWRHVPSDYTFWGEAQTIAASVASVNFRALDTRLASAFAPRLDKWWAEGCAAVGCDPARKLTVNILPSPALKPGWDASAPDTLLIPSPLAADDRAPAIIDIPPALEETVAALIAEHLFNTATNNLVPLSIADAAWLRQTIIEWLATTFTERFDPARTGFIQSIKTNYGVKGLAEVVRSLKPESDIRVVALALRQPVETLAVDWRGFFQWRLEVEKVLVSRNDIASLNALWDTANPDALRLLQQRLSRPAQASGQVQNVAIAPGPDGAPRATVQITLDGRSAIIFFRMVDGIWRRTA